MREWQRRHEHWAKASGTPQQIPRAETMSNRIREIAKSWDEDNRAWLDELRDTVLQHHGDTVQRMLLFGSRARGDWRADSDIDVLVIVDDTASTRKGEIAKLGAVLAIGRKVAPGVLVLTEAEWARLGSATMNIHAEVEKQGVPLV